MATFEISDDELRDLYVRDDNTVRFNLIAPNAQQKAANISKAVSNGKFAFRFGDESYEAVPQTYFSQQIDTNMKPAISGALFWSEFLFCINKVISIWFSSSHSLNTFWSRHYLCVMVCLCEFS